MLAARAALPAETLSDSAAAVWRHLAELLVGTPSAELLGGTPSVGLPDAGLHGASQPGAGLPATGLPTTGLPDVILPGAGRTIAGYVPFGREPGGDLPELLAWLLPAATLLLPVVLPDRDLDWAVYRPGDLTKSAASGAGGLATAALGDGRRISALREPIGARLGPSTIQRAEVIIVPALAVDRRGNRLGRGGGSYDRALARVAADALTVALLHTGELLDELPAQPHDRPVQLVITPQGRYRTAT